jgi:hypothetical protein
MMHLPYIPMLSEMMLQDGLNIGQLSGHSMKSPSTGLIRPLRLDHEIGRAIGIDGALGEGEGIVGGGVAEGTSSPPAIRAGEPINPPAPCLPRYPRY